MKKKFILLIIVLLLTGCQAIRVDNLNIDQIINKFLLKDNKKHNQSYSGYKFYLPRGNVVLERNGLNLKIKYNEQKFFMYVDVISWFHKKKIDTSIALDSYYSKNLSYKDKFGFVEIMQNKDKKDLYYYIIVYNYSRIEGYSTKENLNKNILNASYILSSIKYNRTVLKSLIGEELINQQHEEYDLFTKKRQYEEENYLKATTNVSQDDYNIEDLDEEKIKVIESN